MWLYAGETPILHVIDPVKMPSEPAGVLDHMAFNATGLKDVAAKLKTRGIDYALQQQGETGTWQMFFLDVNGAKVELNFEKDEPGAHESEESLNRFLHSLQPRRPPMNIHTRTVKKAPKAKGMTDAEWQARVDLAAVYRLVAQHGWDDVIYNHCSMRVPGEDTQVPDEAARAAVDRGDGVEPRQGRHA